MITLRTPRLLLRNWEERDRALFFRINSDETVMRYFPVRRSRAESDALMDRLRTGIAETGHGFCAAELLATGECIGFIGLNRVNAIPGLEPGTVEIGWRLAPEFWGKGYVTEATEELFAQGFDRLGLDEIVAFAVADNSRSIAVMKRIGMHRDVEGDFDHPAVPDSHPHLKRHVLYRLSKTDWHAREGLGPAGF